MTTNDKHWKQLNELLAQALQQPTGERDAWITATCADDPALAAELRELLTFDVEETGGIAASIATASARATASVIGTLIGSYRITGKIAEGGMGVVYVGEREGADFDHRVAVKVMHSHKLDEVARERFIAERQILATLNHPNIARLIDGGVSEDGLPYIVMEYIEGENIADYCTRNKLDNAGILRLVMSVCGALQYAHNQLVIHRDIKPSNILVDSSGAPRLLDFGIAKLLQQDGSEGEQTQAELRVLTPLYASPEQLGSQPVSTAADVYGVGLLLYRLLTGRLPYTPTSDHPRDVENAILSTPAEAPSSAVTRADNPSLEQWSSRQRKALRGDLDTILLKALRKEPERRYATVNALSDDLERYLGQLPINARRDTLAYRANRFVARHRLPVALTSLLIVTAVGLTAFYTARVSTEREVAQQTADFLTGLFVDSNPYQRSRKDLTVAELVSTGADEIIKDTSLAPLVRARLLNTIALVLNNVSQTDRAEPLAEESLSLYDNLDAPEDRLKALRTLHNVRRSQGRYDDGLVILAETRELARQIYGEQSLEVGVIACTSAYLHYRKGDYDKMYEEAALSLALHEANLPENDYGLTCPYSSLGTYYQVTGDKRKALDYKERYAKLTERHLGPDDPSLASSLHSLGITYIDLGDYRKAIDYLRRALAIRQRSSDGADFQAPLSMYSLAHAMGKLGQYGEAHQLFKDLVALQIEQSGATHDRVAYWLNGHGDMLANLGATALADQAFQRATDIYTQIDKPVGHFDRSVTLVGHGKVARDRGDLDEAQSLMQRALTIREDTIGKTHTFTQLSRIDLADVLRRQDRLADARVAFDLALTTLQANGDDKHPTTAQALTGLAQVELAEGRHGKARQLLEQSIDMTKESIGIDHMDNVDRRILLADAMAQEGDAETADVLRAAAKATRDMIMADWTTALAENSDGI